METYQIGNKVTCIIRAWTPCKIGPTVLTYSNEPYTILKEVDVSLNFNNNERNATTPFKRELNFNISVLNTVNVRNVHLTEKILHLLYQDLNENEVGLKTRYDNVIADEEGKVYLSTSADKIYQVFIYNESMEMVQAYGEIDPNDIELTPDTSFLIVYQEIGQEVVKLNSPQNLYLTLDLICQGNASEQTSETFIHIHKAGLRVDRNMVFNRTLNAVDLTFEVINSNDDYIVLK